MEKPELSKQFLSRSPSPIRLAQIEFGKRHDKVREINLAIGNVSLPMHPSMQKRMRSLGDSAQFREGVVKYTETEGVEETRQAFFNIIESSGFRTNGLYCQITEGGSQAMELAIIGMPEDRPIMLIDAAYTNYMLFSKRLKRRIISIRRHLHDHGKFSLPGKKEIEDKIKKFNPGAIIVIPYDNPTGHYYDHETMIWLAELTVKYNMWFISDEAYRELHYNNMKTASIWGIDEKTVPGIRGRRISIESSSKVWNACGLRIGAIITDNPEFNNKSVAENTANLSPNSIGQYIFGALSEVDHEDLKKWYKKQRDYYKSIMTRFTEELRKTVPGIIISSPDAAIYSVIDVRNIVNKNFDSEDFVLYCAKEGKVDIDKTDYTLLVAPMKGFYNTEDDEENPGKTQMRISYVETPENMEIVPHIFSELFKKYTEKHKCKR